MRIKGKIHISVPSCKRYIGQITETKDYCLLQKMIRKKEKEWGNGNKLQEMKRELCFIVPF
jgi:hypothetical protein